MLRRTKTTLCIVVVAVILALSINAYAADRLVIGGQSAFAGEAAVIVQKMKEEGGQYRTVTGPYGRIFHVLDFKTYPGVRFVYTTTWVGMENATTSSVLMAQVLPDDLRPDVMVHSGICGNAGPGSVGDIYVNTWWANSGLGRKQSWGFEPSLISTFDPKLKAERKLMYFRADQRLVDLAEEAFKDVAEDEGFKAIVKEMGRANNPPKIITGMVGVSSDWFVANTQTNREWAQLYSIKPTTEAPEGYPVGTIDMETAAAAKVFYESQIPFAAARYPSDGANDTAESTIAAFWKHAADIGGTFVWNWVLEIAKHKDMF